MDTKSTWKRFLKSYYTPHLQLIFFTLLLMLISNSMSMAIPFGLKTVFSNITVSINGIKIISLCLIVLVAKYSIDLFYKTSLVKKTSIIFQTFISDFYNHLLNLGIDFYNNTKLAEFQQRFNQDAYIIERMVINEIPLFLSNSIQLVLMLAFMFYIDPLMMFLSIIFIPLYLPIKKKFDIKLKSNNEKAVKMWGAASSFIDETLSGIRAVKETCSEDYCRKHNAELQYQVASSFTAVENSTVMSSLVTSFFTQLIPFCILIIGTIYFKWKNIPLGNIFPFYYVLNGIYTPIGGLINLSNNANKGKHSIARIYNYIDVKPNIINQINAITEINLNGEIEFANIKYSYGEKCILNDVSFQISSGERVALVGASGAGKTTILSLLFRLYDPQTGFILINGNHINEYDLNMYRKQIGYVGQEIILFHSSIIDNVKISNLNATNEEIFTACKSVGLHEEIMRQEEGYGTIIGEKGMKLSGGQRQRVALARMMLKNPSILVFDESFSQIDSKTENKTIDNMESIFNNRTRIIVSHRLSSIINSDKIIYLDQGKIIDIGKHNYLVKKYNNYSELWSTQV